MVDAAQNSESQGGLGGDCALGIRDVRMIERAIRQEWPIENSERREIVEKLMGAVRTGKIGTSIKAARTLMQADAINARREATATPQQHEHHHSGAVVHATVRGELMNDPAYLEYLRNHQGDGDASAICEGSGPALEAGFTPEVPRPSTNGHTNGKGRH